MSQRAFSSWNQPYYYFSFLKKKKVVGWKRLPVVWMRWKRLNQSASPFPSVSKMPVFLTSKQVWLFLVTSLVSLAYTATERNEAIKRSFHIEPSQSFLTVTIPDEDDVTLMDRLADDEMTTRKSFLVTKPMKAPRQNKRVSSSLVSVLNRCLNRLLTPRFLGPFLIFAVIVSLLNGPLFGLKVLLFSIQFNIVFPTFVCFVSVCTTL